MLEKGPEIHEMSPEARLTIISDLECSFLMERRSHCQNYQSPCWPCCYQTICVSFSSFLFPHIFGVAWGFFLKL